MGGSWSDDAKTRAYTPGPKLDYIEKVLDVKRRFHDIFKQHKGGSNTDGHCGDDQRKEIEPARALLDQYPLTANYIIESTIGCDNRVKSRVSKLIVDKS